MEFFLRAASPPARLAILPGAFNPPTRAHLAMAEAALATADEVLFVLPRLFPHKGYTGASFDLRVELLQAVAAGHPRFSIGASERGLFIDIARECRRHYGAGPRLFLLCGRDAAERIVNWDYGAPGAIHQQLREFELLVATRGGPYEPPPELRAFVHSLALPDEHSEISSSEVRRRIREGKPWEHLVPPAAVPLISAHARAFAAA